MWLTVSHLRANQSLLSCTRFSWNVLLRLDIASQPPDYDFGLPSEDLPSSAVHPPVLTLVLGHKQGYPQSIEVQASDKGSGVGVTVEDVLKIVGANLRVSSSHHEWSGLNDDTRREVEAAFEGQARIEDENKSRPSPY